jgi:hypothetical protein
MNLLQVSMLVFWDVTLLASTHKSIRRYNAEDQHCRENLRSHILGTQWLTLKIKKKKKKTFVSRFVRH